MKNDFIYWVDDKPYAEECPKKEEEQDPWDTTAVGRGLADRKRGMK
jgi:hypothetical protein